MAEPPLDRDQLRRLTERLDVAAQRAERLLSESVLTAATAHSSPDPDLSEPDPARASANGGDDEPRRPPPSGWRQPRPDDGADRDRWLNSDELELLLTVLAGVRDRIPPELRRRLADAVREVLMALRALIDWYLERAERPGPGNSDVEDIPIL